MNGTNERLLKLVGKSRNVAEFVYNVLQHLGWFNVPKEWTKKDLIKFYQDNGGKRP
jgi:hypothetical protein